jgi:hypothetical protein
MLHMYLIHLAWEQFYSAFNSFIHDKFHGVEFSTCCVLLTEWYKILPKIAQR